MASDYAVEHFQMMVSIAETVRALGGEMLEHAYHPESFGSWWFRFAWGRRGSPDWRMVFDGRDGQLLLQHRLAQSQAPWSDLHQQAVASRDVQAVLAAAKGLLEWHRHRPG